MGWPFLGENMELTTLGSQKLVRDRMQKYSGDVFKTSLLGVKMAVLCGEQGNKFIFKNQNTLFARWAPPSLRKAMYQDLDATKHQQPKANFRNFQYDILKPDALKQYVPVMDSLASEHLETEWRGSDRNHETCIVVSVLYWHWCEIVICYLLFFCFTCQTPPLDPSR